MARTPDSDQLDLFPGMASATVTPKIRPWRATLADGWQGGDVYRESFEPMLVDLLRRNRELLKALKLAGVPEDAPDVRSFQQQEAPLIDHLMVLRRGELDGADGSDVVRSLRGTAVELAETRQRILEGLAAEVRVRVLGSEPRVRIPDYELNKELAAIEFAIAEEKGEIVEIVFPVDDQELPSPFIGPADVEATMEQALHSWKAEQDQRPLPPQLRLATLLKGIPAIWLDAVCVALDVEPREHRHRKDRERAVARIVSDAGRLRQIVQDQLSAPERQLLGLLQEKGGQVTSGVVTRRFGSDDEDGWFWNEDPPTSVLGRVRLHGLAYVGRLAVSGRSMRTVAIPREVREPLAVALRDADE
ncbi:MAG: hypothetical protein V3T72_10315 [Thermoanaerobaculia bacterium]